MLEFFEKLFTSDFMPHGHCYLWSPSIPWLNVLSDIAITLSYYSIPVALLVFIRRRKDLAFSWVFVLFGVFIFACGTTHLMEIWTVWNGTYRIAGVVKLFTALASVLTAILLWPTIPKLLALPSPKQVEIINIALLAEISERKLAQEKLAALNLDLERRIHNATSQVQMALAQKGESLIRERSARAEAEKASRFKNEFLATLSHELRTPLNALSSWIQLLSDSAIRDGATMEALPVLRRNVTKLSEIIDVLLDMSIILTGSLSLNIAPYSLIDVANEVIDNLRATADSKNVKLKMDIGTPLPLLKGDHIRIRQIIWNLLTNAIRFTPSGKSITVSVMIEGSAVLLKVLDQGRGIDPKFLPFVFDRFRQESSSSSREYSGLGLGLSIGQQLAELHGGSITAESKGVGFGAEFTLRLPLPL